MSIYGSGGGNKKKAASTPAVRAPREAKDSLVAKNTARIIDLISEGKIKGLVNGFQSVFFDDTPLETPEGTFNFQGITCDLRLGEPDQDIVEGFPSVEAEVDVGVELLFNTPVVRTISDADLDAIRIKLRTPQMSNQNLTTGDIGETQVDFKIEVQPNGGSYALVDKVYAFIPMSGTVTASQACKGLRVTVKGTVTGPVGSIQSRTFQVQYRRIQSPSASWVDFGIRTLDQKIPGSSSSRNSNSSGTTGNVSQTGSATISTTFEVIDLADGRYEFRVLQGTKISAYEYSVQNMSIKGKTSSPYEVAYRIKLPAGGAPWNVRITRLTPDSTSAALQNSLFFSTYTKLTDTKLIYPDSAYAALVLDASLFGSDIPTRSFEVFGIELQVPDNYDPETRTYTGFWGGNFQTAYSNNPAWILYDLLTNTRYGLGESIDPDKVDKFALYAIAQYCDELVPDGYGGTEPRFTFNSQIANQEEAYQVINAMCSVFRGMAFWSSGSVTVSQDRPSDVVKIVTPANVINGDFVYSGSSQKARHSAVIVTWNDPLDSYRQATVVVEDPELIQRFGWRPTDTVAIGCTSKGQALRWGGWILETEKNETETVSYQASWDHVDVRPGDVVAIHDPHYAGVRVGGRLVSCTGVTAVLDAPVTLQGGETYILSAVLPDNTVENRDVITPSTGVPTSTLTLASGFTNDPLPGAMWVMTASNLSPRLFKIIQIRENEKNIFEITGLLHDAAKYDRLEFGINAEEPQYTIFPTGALQPPLNMSFQESLYLTSATVKSALTVSWQNSPDPRAQFYILEMKSPSDTDFKFVITTQSGSYTIQDSTDGLYEFKVTAVDGLGGLQSSTLSSSYLAGGLSNPPSDVTGFNVNILNNTAFLSWNPVTDLDLDHYVIRYAALGTLATWAASVVLVERIAKGTSSVTVPSQSGNFLIKAVDTSGIESLNATKITVSFSEIGELNVVETLIEDPTFAGVKDRVSVSAGALRLVGTDTVDDWTNVDLVANWDIGESGEFQTEGYYYFDNDIDLTDVYTSRLSADLNAYGLDTLSNIDSWPDWDAIENIDSSDPSTWRVDLQVRTTNEDPATAPDPITDPEDYEAFWGEWKNFTTGSYTARAFIFRLGLRSLQAGVTPVVDRLRVVIDMPDRVEGERDLTCPIGGMRVTFPGGAFKVTPAIAPAGQDMATGDRMAITGQSADGFDIEFFNSAGTSISRTFDYVCRGYGRIITP